MTAVVGASGRAARIADGQFEDGRRMECLIDAFAGHYIGARTGRIAAPRCWQASWDVATDDGLLIVQHLGSLAGADDRGQSELTAHDRGM